MDLKTTYRTIPNKKIQPQHLRGFFVIPLLLLLLTSLALSAAATNAESKTAKKTITIRVLEPYNITKTIARTEMVNVDVMIPVEKTVPYYDFIDVPTPVTETIQDISAALLYKDGKYIIRLLGEPKPNTISVIHNGKTLESFRAEDMPYVISWNPRVSPLVTYNRINKVSIPKYLTRIEYIPNIKAVEKTTYQNVTETFYREVEKVVETDEETEDTSNLIAFASFGIPSLTPEEAAWNYDSLYDSYINDASFPDEYANVIDKIKEKKKADITYIDQLQHLFESGSIDENTYRLGLVGIIAQQFSDTLDTIDHAIAPVLRVVLYPFLKLREYNINKEFKRLNDTAPVIVEIKNVTLSDEEVDRIIEAARSATLSSEIKKAIETKYNKSDQQEEMVMTSLLSLVDAGSHTLGLALEFTHANHALGFYSKTAKRAVQKASDFEIADNIRNFISIKRTKKSEKKDDLVVKTQLKTKINVKKLLNDLQGALDQFQERYDQVFQKYTSHMELSVRPPNEKRSMVEKLLKKEVTPEELNALDDNFLISDPIRARVVIRSQDPKEIARLKKEIPELILKEFKTKNFENFKEHPYRKESGYRAIHFDGTTGLNQIKTEIQFMTRRQDQWANWEHKVRYKPENDHLKQLFTNKNFEKQFEEYAYAVADYLEALDNGQDTAQLLKKATMKKPKALPDHYAFNENENYWDAGL